MNKSDLVVATANQTGLSQTTVKTALDGALAVISETLAKGDDITLVGFGNFTVRTKKERMGHNPKTGEKITIAAKKAIGFKAGKSLKAAIN